MRRTSLIILAACCLSILILLPACHDRSAQTRKFLRMAEQTNRSCPIRLNETVTLDSTRYDEKVNQVTYYYSVTGQLDNASYMDAHQAEFQQALKEAADNSAEMEDYRQSGTSISYVYLSATTHQRLAAFSFTLPK